jgi:hypothetical protein
LVIGLLSLSGSGVARAQYGDYGGYYVPPGSRSFGGDYVNPSYSGGYGYGPVFGSNMYNSGYSSSFPQYGIPGYRRYRGSAAPPYGSLGRTNAFGTLGYGPYRSTASYPPGWYDAAWLDAQLGRTSHRGALSPVTASTPVSLWSLGLGPGYVDPSYGAANYGVAGLSRRRSYTHPGSPGTVLPTP